MRPHLLCLEYTCARVCTYLWVVFCLWSGTGLWSWCAFMSKRYEALVFLFAVFRVIYRPEPRVFLRPTLGIISTDTRVSLVWPSCFPELQTISAANIQLPVLLAHDVRNFCLLCQLGTPRCTSAYPLLRLLGFCSPFSWQLPDFLPVRPPNLCCGLVDRFNIRACVLWCTMLGFLCTYKCRAILSVPVWCYSASVV